VEITPCFFLKRITKLSLNKKNKQEKDERFYMLKLNTRQALPASCQHITRRRGWSCELELLRGKSLPRAVRWGTSALF
jgi:hypothetical protein